MGLFNREDRHARAERIRDDFRDIGDQGRELGRGLRHDSEDAIEEARARSQAQYARMAKDARRRRQTMRQSTQRSMNEADRYVQDHAWSGIGVAAIAGAVVGFLVSRR
ncbi:DUF883 family protein [Salinicola aestuarinus]|uniref:DUF883 family protein n=1 Tax=Salinicola aestuarinus TaxID=1949082 RepID=UPI000DA25AB3|nr:DUF883 family protein [Salinicola aestuarinus]